MPSRLGALPGGQALLSTVVVHSCRPGSGRGWYRKARQRGYQFPGYTCIRVWRAERDLLYSEADRLLGW